MNQLHNWCMDAVAECKQFKPAYNPGYFLKMRAVDGIEKTVHTLINKEETTEGFAKLWEHKRLDLSIEAIIYVSSELHPLFSVEELKRCEKRLREYGYFAGGSKARRI